ncbi:hypothetical protein [Deinococcus actinosclerus]|uniref:Uncharacterized protein n=1 Tax=Deinococcus actinosclerus TaxID=1768108 RepID=A0ABM5X298_9DEIO|nr:hypothetical protein [Deinococcus actinosclerus]ALW87843.1 hypothetical protein AUC44_02150 [Deinococcus actinosclerus]
MTQRNPRLSRPPIWTWVGLALLLIGAAQGTPTSFTREALKTLLIVGGQVLLVGSMALVGWRAGWVKPLMLAFLLGLIAVSAAVNLWGLWDSWQTEMIRQ